MEDVKKFQLRVSKKLWKFLNEQAMDKEMSMNAFINLCLEKAKSKVDKRLTGRDTIVS